MRMFERTFKIVLVLIMAISLSSAMAGEESQKITKKDVPAEVLEAFINVYAGTAVSGIVKEVIEGKTYYEFECRQGETEKNIIYLEDGTLFSIEEEIAINALPQAVIDSLREAYPKGEIYEAEKISGESGIEFEVAIEMEEGDEEIEYEIILTQKGEIKNAEQIQDHDIDEDDEDEPGDIDDDDEEDEDDPDDIQEDDDEDED